ncbi:hypothetical protein UFOVP32_42 [uncultured Caudovirales phage]|uniref:Uncharacterized protein n=1 Tax=uncultured Caudovirales phage TaxID=2100421 RepID=A0A6J5KLH5_9CAUD|nr:hypothetical protein UFOVP32_42 [uncultured Caudovirales phage]CAB4123647.1 hypothetical protein UFOVP50_34 [uncultured Caudovirales phage]
MTDLNERLRKIGCRTGMTHRMKDAVTGCEAAAYIEKLEAANLAQSCIKVDDHMRIDELKWALLTIKEWHGYGLPPETNQMIDAAIEGAQ